MYSALYHHYQVRSDPAYSRPLATAVVRGAVERIVGIREKAPLEYENVPGTPWLSLSLVHASPSGDYASNPQAREINAVVVVGSKTQPAEVYEKRLIQLAKELGWQCVIEEDEDGNQDVVLQEPQANRDEA